MIFMYFCLVFEVENFQVKVSDSVIRVFARGAIVERGQ